MQYLARLALPSVLAHLGRSSLSALLILTLLSIVVPGVAHASSGDGGCALTHRVHVGETLTWIAARYGLSVDELARMNRLDNADYIYEDQELCVPGNGDRGFGENGYNNGGFDDDNGYRGFGENGFDNGTHGRDPRIYGSAEWSDDNGNGKYGFDNGNGNGNGYRGFGENGYDNGGFDNGNSYHGFGENGYGNGGFDNGNGYRGFGENGYDDGTHGRDPRIYGSAEWSDDNGNGGNGFDNGNGYRGYGDNGDGRGSYGKPYDSPGYGGE
jgi:LysM repeat protein